MCVELGTAWCACARLSRPVLDQAPCLQALSLLRPVLHMQLATHRCHHTFGYWPIILKPVVIKQGHAVFQPDLLLEQSLGVRGSPLDQNCVRGIRPLLQQEVSAIGPDIVARQQHCLHVRDGPCWSP